MPPAAPPAPSEAKPRSRKGQNINVWLPDDLLAAFERQLGKTRRTKTAEIQIMMEQYLEQAGLWPPAEQGDEE